MLCPLASLILRPLRRHPWLGYAAGLGVFCLAFLLRFMAGGLLDVCINEGAELSEMQMVAPIWTPKKTPNSSLTFRAGC